ncbi:MAG: Crp/Fnr family transcriptional regulator [Leptolyngbyaceae cyanobacterium T60_A2020_046]|nr:Crp/Fnr family transcriptional regulator [Leptolyngbyaceae cyanobacterium T60_A2020_046]
MATEIQASEHTQLMQLLTQHTFLFRGLDAAWLAAQIDPTAIAQEKLYSSRPVYTAFQPDTSLDFLYFVVAGGPVVVRSTPLDRIVAMTYPGGCFGMRSLPFDFGRVCRAFPSLVEAYKTTDVVKISLSALKTLHEASSAIQDRYGLLFELREKFQYHLLNCSTYPPQAVASLLRALVYQERSLGSQPQPDGVFVFDLPIDIIAHACQLNHRTVEQVLKGMVKESLIQMDKSAEAQGDAIRVLDPEALKGVYSATRDKVSWWPLR